MIEPYKGRAKKFGIAWGVLLVVCFISLIIMVSSEEASFFFGLVLLLEFVGYLILNVLICWNLTKGKGYSVLFALPGAIGGPIWIVILLALPQNKYEEKV